MIKDFIAAFAILGFFGLLLWATFYQKSELPAPKISIIHEVPTHQITCTVPGEKYCEQYEIRRIVQE